MSFSIKVAMTYSPTNLCSTIGAVGLNFSVRDGKRWIPNAINRLNKGLMPCISYNEEYLSYALAMKTSCFSLVFFFLISSFIFACSANTEGMAQSIDSLHSILSEELKKLSGN